MDSRTSNPMSINQLVQAVLDENPGTEHTYVAQNHRVENERKRRYAAMIGLEVAKRMQQRAVVEPETTRLRQLLWRIQPILNAGSEIAHAVEREVGSVHTNREGPLSGPAEPPSVEWISVKDKLPEFGQAVVYFFSLVGSHVGHYDGPDEHGLPVFAGRFGFLAGDVTHWIPLPPRPVPYSGSTKGEAL
jgi:hypothetical protein